MIVINALFGFWESVFAFVPNFVYNGLIVSIDPVAADYVGIQILMQSVKGRNNFKGLFPLLDNAADMRLRTRMIRKNRPAGNRNYK